MCWCKSRQWLDYQEDSVGPVTGIYCIFPPGWFGDCGKMWSNECVLKNICWEVQNKTTIVDQCVIANRDCFQGSAVYTIVTAIMIELRSYRLSSSHENLFVGGNSILVVSHVKSLQEIATTMVDQFVVVNDLIRFHGVFTTIMNEWLLLIVVVFNKRFRGLRSAPPQEMDSWWFLIVMVTNVVRCSRSSDQCVVFFCCCCYS